VTLPVTVTVLDTNGVPQEGLPVYAFDGTTYTGYNATTDANGEVQLTLPEGSYRFRSDLNGTQFWSDETNHCTIPGCESASITVTVPLTVTVQSQTGSPYADLPVYAFTHAGTGDGDTYTGFHGTSDADGQVVFTLPEGSYRFRADYALTGTGDNVQFWSGVANHCAVPGCLEAVVEIPGWAGEVNVTIDYAYDPLYRLTAADYDSGEFFHYTYDAVGNRLTQATHKGSNVYAYDIASRLIEVDGVSFVWDDNGNLIQDDRAIYAYDYANRLKVVLMGGDQYLFDYNGLGDRLRQTVNGAPAEYTLDIVSSLTQVLTDGKNVYLYGVGRVGGQQPGGWQYHLPDALGSVRQLEDASASVTLAQAYEPFGGVISSSGSAATAFQFTGELVDETELLYLRARYYAPGQGRFISRDIWRFAFDRPITLNAWPYAHDNPVKVTDASGHTPPSPYDHRNLTKWLAREMLANAAVPEVLDILKNNRLSDEFKKYSDSGSQLLSLIFKGFAALEWKALVHDGARWDFKDRIEWELRIFCTGEYPLWLCRSGGRVF